MGCLWIAQQLLSFKRKLCDFMQLLSYFRSLVALQLSASNVADLVTTTCIAGVTIPRHPGVGGFMQSL